MPHISFSKSALQEFRFCHDPSVYKGYPSVVPGRKVKYLSEFLDTKLSEKKIFRLPKRHEFQARYVIW